jgi:hypothetical protein
MTKTRDGVLPRSGSGVRMPPGAPMPRSGIFEEVGPRANHTGRHVDSTGGNSLPPQTTPRQGWTLVKSALSKN